MRPPSSLDPFSDCEGLLAVSMELYTKMLTKLHCPTMVQRERVAEQISREILLAILLRRVLGQILRNSGALFYPTRRERVCVAQNA
jgi:hypothetical protein